MTAERDMTSNSWRFSGDPMDGPAGLHASVMLIFPTFILVGMFWQFTGIALWWPFLIFWAIFIVITVYARVRGYTPREVVRRFIIQRVFKGKYKVGS